MNEENLKSKVDLAPCFVSLKGKKYYLKLVEDGGNELIGNYLANLCGINTANDKIISIDGEYYYLSYDLNNDGEYKDAADAGIVNLSLYEIWSILEEKYPKDTPKLMKQIIKIFRQRTTEFNIR